METIGEIREISLFDRKEEEISLFDRKEEQTGLDLAIGSEPVMDTG